MTIMVMDGQGGRMGKSVVEQIRKRFPEDEILAIGTNTVSYTHLGYLWGDHGKAGDGRDRGPVHPPVPWKRTG